MANWKITASDLDEQINRAKAAETTALKNEPRAQSARYSPSRRQIVVELTNGCSFIFPVDKAQGLAGASNKDLAAVTILGKGSGLHWEKLDADLSIASLVVGIFGSQTWMREIARQVRRRPRQWHKGCPTEEEYGHAKSRLNVPPREDARQ